MTETRCDFSDLPTTGCSHCLGHVEASPPQPFSRGFVAQYDGFCSNCGERIVPGEPIKREGENYSHKDCDD